MYHLLAGLYGQWTERPQYNVLLLGIQGAGKTAWLDRVRGHVTGTGGRPLERFTPTVGQNVVDLRLRYATLHFWDLGGEQSLRSIWSRYVYDAHALVWAMNALDWAAATMDVTEASQDGETIDQALALRRRNESWEALTDLRRKDGQIAQLPLLIIMTQVDQLTPTQQEHFRDAIKDVIRRKLADQRLSDGRTEEDWGLVICSAKTG
jgi:ADP-ribosylation factor related protein 1